MARLASVRRTSRLTRGRLTAITGAENARNAEAGQSVSQATSPRLF